MMTMISFTFAFIRLSGVIFILSIGGKCCSTGGLTDALAECCFNYYKDGYNCKTCPTGYYGKNCSKVCDAPYFGLGCKQTCECYPCHHIHGCMDLSTTIDNLECPTGFIGVGCSEVCPSLYYGSGCIRRCNCTTCHHIYGCNQTIIMRETTTFESGTYFERKTQTPKQKKKDSGRLLIILAGSVVSLALILIIIHELYTYRHVSNRIGVHQVVNNVYEDIVVANDQIVLRCI